MVGALITIPLSTVLKFLPVWTNGAFPDLPFFNRMEIDFVVIVLLMVGISLMKPQTITKEQTMDVDTSMFKINTSFAIGSLLIMGILTALYTVFW